jgi:hypothetical protein
MNEVPLDGPPPVDPDAPGEPFRLPRIVNIICGLFTFAASIAAGIWSDELANLKPWMLAIALTSGAVTLWGKPLVRG